MPSQVAVRRRSSRTNFPPISATSQCQHFHRNGSFLVTFEVTAHLLRLTPSLSIATCCAGRGGCCCCCSSGKNGSGSVDFFTGAGHFPGRCGSSPSAARIVGAEAGGAASVGTSEQHYTQRSHEVAGLRVNIPSLTNRTSHLVCNVCVTFYLFFACGRHFSCFIICARTCHSVSMLQ